MAQNNKNCIKDVSNIESDQDINNCQSEISQFFAGCNVLITGGSGFLGVLLIEKLLRCCPAIEKMYIFIRKKKEKSSEERIKDQFDNVVYDKLKKEQPNFYDKIVLIEADLNKSDLGLSQENRKYILDTNMIFHVAATVRFNETIRNAVNINVRATKQLLLIAKEMPNLKSFVHVSTAYCNCIYNFIDETFYPPPLETDKIINLIDILDDKQLEEITPILLSKWPNTYALTKAIAEDAVRQYGVGIPVCIVRPSIITTTNTEPLLGWCNNVYGAIGVVVGSALGIIRTVHCNPENKANIVPADYVISHLIAANWDIAKRSIENVNLDMPEKEQIPIYNYVMNAENSITWYQFLFLNKKYGLQIPSIHVFWYFMLILNKHKFINEICTMFLHTIPGIIVDTVFFLKNQEPKLTKIYKKIKTFNNVLSYFTTRQWQFNTNNVEKLWNSLNLADQQIFYFDMNNFDWELYIKNMIFGLRVYLIKDPIDTLDKGRVKYRKLAIIHYILVTIITILFIWIIINIISTIIF